VQHEAIVSSTTGFAAIGAMLCSSANRRFGRRPVLLASALIFTFGAVVMGVSRNFTDLLVGRCIVGIAVGFASSTVPLYIAELAPPQVRGLLVSVNNGCIVVGQVLAAIIDGLFSSDKETGWRWMLGLGAVPSAIQFIGLLFLPESPRWLITRGRESEARKVLERLRSSGGVDVQSVVDAEIDEIVTSLALSAQDQRTLTTRQVPPASPAVEVVSTTTKRLADSAAHVQSIDDAVVRPAPGQDTAAVAVAPPSNSEGAGPGAQATAGSTLSRGASLADLWAVRRQLSLGAGLLMLQQMVGINTIMYYCVTILRQAHVGTVQTAIWLNVPVASAQLVGCIIGGALIDRVGRRTLVLTSLVGVTLSLATVGGAFFLQEIACPTNATNVSHLTRAAATSLDDTATASATPASELLAVMEANAVASVRLVATAAGGGANGEGNGDPPSCVAARWTTVGGMVIYLLCFGVGMSPVPWAVSAEIFPMRVRTACIGITTAANWVMNFIVAATFLSLQDAVTPSGSFWLYGAIAFLGSVWLWCWMPETAGRSLEQIEALFAPAEGRSCLRLRRRRHDTGPWSRQVDE
jgi:SP family myo-inositol transporter-like MFS transporter 13